MRCNECLCCGALRGNSRREHTPTAVPEDENQLKFRHSLPARIEERFVSPPHRGPRRSTSSSWNTNSAEWIGGHPYIGLRRIGSHPANFIPSMYQALASRSLCIQECFRRTHPPQRFFPNQVYRSEATSVHRHDFRPRLLIRRNRGRSSGIGGPASDGGE